MSLDRVSVTKSLKHISPWKTLLFAITAPFSMIQTLNIQVSSSSTAPWSLSMCCFATRISSTTPTVMMIFSILSNSLKLVNGLINSLENYQANMDFTNNTFDNNYATQAGAVLSSSNMKQQTSTLNLTNNTFTNNRCDQSGGVFYFVLTDYNMHSVNNTYINNTASLAGGVGYAFRASFVFLEEKGTYLNNSAGSFGGAWCISLNTYKANLQNLEFSQTSFVNSLAQQSTPFFVFSSYSKIFSLRRWIYLPCQWRYGYQSMHFLCILSLSKAICNLLT